MGLEQYTLRVDDVSITLLRILGSGLHIRTEQSTFFFLSFFLAMPAARVSSWARKQTCTTAATKATAVIMSDP